MSVNRVVIPVARHGSEIATSFSHNLLNDWIQEAKVFFLVLCGFDGLQAGKDGIPETALFHRSIGFILHLLHDKNE